MNKSIKKVCIDVDKKRGSIINAVEKKINNHTNVVSWHRKESKKGWHYFVILKRKITVNESFEMRLFLIDDYRRLAMDMIRWNRHHDLKLLDVCFDKKTRINERVKI